MTRSDLQVSLDLQVGLVLSPYLGDRGVQLPQQGRSIIRRCEDPPTLNPETLTHVRGSAPWQVRPGEASPLLEVPRGARFWTHRGVELHAGDALGAAVQRGSVGQRAW